MKLGISYPVGLAVLEIFAEVAKAPSHSVNEHRLSANERRRWHWQPPPGGPRGYVSRVIAPIDAPSVQGVVSAGGVCPGCSREHDNQRSKFCEVECAQRHDRRRDAARARARRAA